jgi:hypothetical protein
MLIIGSCVQCGEDSKEKIWFLIQNSSKSMPLQEVSAAYLCKHDDLNKGDTSSSRNDSNSSSASSGMIKIQAAIMGATERMQRRRRNMTVQGPKPNRRKSTAKDKNQDSDTESEASDSDQEDKEPPMARSFTPKPKKQRTLTSFNFRINKAANQQTPKESGKEVESASRTGQEGSRVRDAERMAREGGGNCEDHQISWAEVNHSLDQLLTQLL